MIKKIMALFVAVAMMSLLFIGCTSTGEPQASEKESEPVSDTESEPVSDTESEPVSEDGTPEKIVIGVSLDTLDHGFWAADVNAMEGKAAELGAELDIQVAQGDANVQNKQIEDLLAKGVSAIICAAKDSKAILQAVKKCNEKDVPFIWNDRQILSTDDAKVAYGAGTDNYALCEGGAQWLADYANENGVYLKILEMQGDLADSNTPPRSQALMDIVAANSDVMEVVQTVPTEWNVDKALAGAVNALQANQDINCIFCHSDYLLPSVQSALKQNDKYIKAGEEGHIVICTIGGETITTDAVRDGYVDAIMAMPIVTEGQMCVQAAVDLAQGKTLEGEFGVDPGFIVDVDNLDEKIDMCFGKFAE